MAKQQIEVNMNSMVRINLTSYGFNIVKNSNYAESILQYHHIKDSIYEIELWLVMQIFGDILYMGNTEVPFVANNIIIITKEQ